MRTPPQSGYQPYTFGRAPAVSITCPTTPPARHEVIVRRCVRTRRAHAPPRAPRTCRARRAVRQRTGAPAESRCAAAAKAPPTSPRGRAWRPLACRLQVRPLPRPAERGHPDFSAKRHRGPTPCGGWGRLRPAIRSSSATDTGGPVSAGHEPRVNYARITSSAVRFAFPASRT